MYCPVILMISVMGLIASFLLNLATFVHYNSLNPFTISVLGIGLAIVWIGTIPAWRKLGFSPRQMQFAPDEIKFPALALVGYFLFTIVTIILSLAKANVPLEVDAAHHLPLPAEYNARIITSVFMCFYGVAAATQNLAKSSRD
ncbi:MAG TPA: hypothetical protein VN774_09880 [Candidatus Limnocylindrales bacterium]|nr:hypothetical protein [Candidatus Limnocylindrales bacterium]